jgi:cell division protein FtsQ
MSPSTKRRKPRRKKRDLQKFLRVLRNLLLITLSIIAVYYFSQSPFFALKNIEARGNSQVTEAEIIKKSGLRPGINYFELDTELVKKRLLSIPLMETVKVKKRIPDGVVITIEEREPLALFCAQESFVVIDGKGYCLEKYTTSKSYDLPIITGLKLARNIDDQPQVSFNESIPDTDIPCLQLIYKSHFLITGQGRRKCLMIPQVIDMGWIFKSP